MDEEIQEYEPYKGTFVTQAVKLFLNKILKFSLLAQLSCVGVCNVDIINVGVDDVGVCNVGVYC